MFSYLHGIRPNNRRSAIPAPTTSHNANTGRYYHESSSNSSETASDPPPSRHSQHRSLPEASLYASLPPLLPPVPLGTSHHGSQNKNQRTQPQQPAGFETTSVLQKGASEGRLIPRTSTEYDEIEDIDLPASPHQKSQNHSQITSPLLPTEHLRPAPGRRKRPIDIRFEEMRAYTEPPFRQSIYMPRDSIYGVLQPYRPPPPPPMTIQTSSPSQIPYIGRAKPQREVPASARRFSDSRSTSDHGLTQSSIQATHPVSDPSPQNGLANQHRHSKAKLHLLNPMTLLARRRSHQAVEAAYAESQNPPALQLPDNYDPRIRGKVVHDFSAPRLGRNVATRTNDGLTQDISTKKLEQDVTARRGASPASVDREHAPVFREHFDDGLEKSQDPAMRSSTFLHQMSIQALEPQPDPSHLPAFARKLPSNISANVDAPRETAPPPPSAVLQVVLESPDRDQAPALPSPPVSPPRVPSTAMSILDLTAQGLESPKRYKSNASRFSFDLAGVGSSAQEKLLEDKHRQNANRKQRESTLSDEEANDQYNNADFDGIDNNVYEERIPGVNCDEDDEAVEKNDMPVLQRDMESFNVISPNKSSFESTSSLVSTGVTSLDTPRDFLGQPVVFAVPKSSPHLSQTTSGPPLQGAEKATGSRPHSTPAEPLRSYPRSEPLQREVSSEINLADLPQRQTYMDDDIYFDDGMIDDMGDISDRDFDEDVFDDNSNGLYGLPLRDRTLQPVPDPKLDLGIGHMSGAVEELVSHNNVLEITGSNAPSPHRSSSSDGVTAELRDALTELNQHNQPVFSQTAGLTQDNLAAYNHNSLSMSINHAATNGRFERTLSLPNLQGPEEPRFGYDSGGNTAQITLDTSGPANNDDHDDEISDDDLIVAAANAEALENDDEGFYGQEFGFFARASNSTQAEYSNGGYFGPRAIEGVHRSHSGKVDFQEPSLTPITERSEWSNRNSTISLAMHSHPLSAVTSTSPQYADMPLDDVEMGLALLQKLRRSAWGSSDVSLQSSSNSQNSGSPMTHLPPNVLFSSSLQANNSNINLQNMASSFHSFSSSNGQASSNDSDPSPSVDSPTITLMSANSLPPQTSTLVIATSTQPMNTPPQPAMPPPPLPATARETSPPARNEFKKGHSRNSSGAESVSYKEEGGKWVIEKRRMSETGQQILGRSVVQGGRI